MSADRGRGRGRGRSRGRGGDRGASRGASSDGSVATTTSLPFHPRGGRGGQSPGRGRGGFGTPGTGRGAIYRDGEPIPAPNTSITSFEDETIKRQTTSERDTYLGKLPIRPAYGKQGNPIVLRTNYFTLNLRNLSQKLFRYDISFVPETPALSAPKKRRYIQLLLENPVFRNVAASDYATIIITSEELNLGSDNRQRFSVVSYDKYEAPFPAPSSNEPEGRRAARQRRTRNLQVEYNSSYGAKELFDFVRSVQPGATYTATRDVVQAMNIVLSRAPNFHPQVAKSGQNKFYPYSDMFMGRHDREEGSLLGQGLKSLRGVYSSIRLGPNRVLVNVNVASGAFFQEGRLDVLMASFSNYDRSLPGMKRLQAFLKNLKVVTEHTKNDDNTSTIRKVHTIYSLAQQPRLGANAQEVTFFWTNSSGQQRHISVRQYFKEHYMIDLQAWQAPVVNVGSAKDPVYMPPEVCSVYGGQPARKMLSGSQTDNMLKFAARAPNLNAETIEGHSLEILEVSSAQQPNTIGLFGLEMSTKMLTVPARILPPVKIAFQQPQPTTPLDGGWNLRNQKFRRAAELGKFSGFEIRLQGKHPKTNDFAGALRKVISELQRYGMRIPDTLPPAGPLTIPSLAPTTWDKLKGVVDDKLKRAASNGIKWLLICIPEKHGALYAAVKSAADTKYGIQTVLVQDKNCAKVYSKEGGQERSDLGLIGNLALKFCGKAGGLCWAMEPAGLSLVDNDTMLVGLDVTHPSPGSRKNAPSIVAIVASIDKELSSWPGNLCIQTSRREMVEGLKDLMIERLRLFQSRNANRLPKKIIMFRDGVSEGQFELVLNTEYPAMVEAFNQLYGGGSKHPKVSIIIVGKRHHTRFYPTSRDHADRSFNPVPGVVVDRHITGYGERLWDFYLQPHKALQGTAKPAHYVVIKNEIGFGHEQLEKLAHTLSYGFHRATKAVSICAPAYCADLLAERGRCYLYEVMSDATGSEHSFDPSTASWTRGVHAAMQDTMFYI